MKILDVLRLILSKHNSHFIVIVYELSRYNYEKIIIVLTFMSLTFPVIWGQTKIQKYAGTAMPYPNRTDSSVTFRDGMTPFYINHLGRHGARFPTSRKTLDK